MNMEVGGSEGVKLRPLNCELGLLSRPDGSATVSQGDTSVMAAVYGPGEVKSNREQMDKASVEVVYKPKSGLPGCADKSQERILRNTCETVLLVDLHPRSAINVTIQEMQNSGSFLAVCVNAACLALLDAGLSMRSTVAGVSCSIDKRGQIILDPTNKQELECVATLTFVFDSVTKTVVTVSAQGQYSKEQFQICLSMCESASSNIFQFYKDTLEKKLLRTE